MNDPYKQIAEETSKALQMLYDMIFALAKRTLTCKEFIEFGEEVTKSKGGEQK